MAEPLPRTVVRESAFEDERHVLIRSAVRADEYVEGAEFSLARDPVIGMPLEDSYVWSLAMAPIGGRQIVLYYAFDDRTVWLMALRPLA